MENAKIKIKRGTNTKITAHGADILEAGQPLYNLDDNILTIGNGGTIADTKSINLAGTAKLGTTAGTTATTDRQPDHIFEANSNSVKNASDAVNVTTNINNKLITDIFEPDGLTVKTATKALAERSGVDFYMRANEIWWSFTSPDLWTPTLDDSFGQFIRRSSIQFLRIGDTTTMNLNFKFPTCGTPQYEKVIEFPLPNAVYSQFIPSYQYIGPTINGQVRYITPVRGVYKVDNAPGFTVYTSTDGTYKVVLAQGKTDNANDWAVFLDAEDSYFYTPTSGTSVMLRLHLIGARSSSSGVIVPVDVNLTMTYITTDRLD